MAFFHTRRSQKKGLNFAKFHARGSRGLQRAHPEVGIPLPPTHPSRGRSGTVPEVAVPGRWSTRRRARGYLRRGGAGAAGGYSKRGGYGAHVGHGYRARANTGAAGYRGKQAAFRGKRGVFPGGYRARGTIGGAGDYLCQGRAYTGARLPRRAAQRHSLPPAGRLPGGCTPGEDHCFPAACDGFSPFLTATRDLRRLPGAAGAKKYFFAGRGFRTGIRPWRISRAHIEAGRPGGATRILI